MEIDLGKLGTLGKYINEFNYEEFCAQEIRLLKSIIKNNEMEIKTIEENRKNGTEQKDDEKNLQQYKEEIERIKDIFNKKENLKNHIHRRLESKVKKFLTDLKPLFSTTMPTHVDNIEKIYFLNEQDPIDPKEITYAEGVNNHIYDWLKGISYEKFCEEVYSKIIKTSEDAPLEQLDMILNQILYEEKGYQTEHGSRGSR